MNPGTSDAFKTAGESEHRVMKRRRLWAWILILAVALGLRVAGLGSQSVWFDEALTVNASRIDRPLLWGDLLANLHGPLHAVILHGWTELAGDSEAALRWPSVIASILTLPVLWFLVRRLLGERVAWISVVALALSPMSIWYAQEARNYSLLLLFITLAILTWLSLLERPGSLGRIVLHAVVLFLGFLSNLAMLFLIPVQVFWLLGRRRSQWLATVAVWMLIAILLLPWEIRFYETQVRESGELSKQAGHSIRIDHPRTRTSAWGIPFTFHEFAGGKSLGPPIRSLHEDRWGAIRRHLGTVIPAAVVFGGLVLWGLVGRVIPSRRLRWNLLAWLLIPPLGIWILALLNLKELNPRYAFVAFPAFLLLLSAGWTGLPSWRSRFVSAAIIIVLWGVALARVHFDAEYRKEDHRSAAAWLRQQVGPETLWVTVGADYPLRNYYMRDLFDGRRICQGEYRKMGWYRAAWPDAFWDELEELVSSHSKILFVESRAFNYNHEERLREFLEEHCGGPPREERWTGIRVLWCDTRAPLQVSGHG